MHWFLGIFISAVFVFFIAYQIDFQRLLAALQSAQYGYLIPSVVLLLGTLWLRAWRWRYLLEPVKPINILNLLSATAIGFMANMILPARTGEVVRAYIIGQKEQVSKVTCFATIVVERILDLLSVLLILALLLVFVRFPSETAALTKGLQIGGYVSTLLSVGFLGGLWLLKWKTALTIRLLRRCLSFLPEQWLGKMIETLLSFISGLQAIAWGQHLLGIGMLSVVLWLAAAYSNFFILQSFGLHLPLYAPFFFLVVQILGVVVPSSPGFIGTYHAAVIVGFTVFQVSPELALSVAIIMHAAFFFPFILLGLLFLWRENLSLRTLWSVKAERT
jgi:hypothetical protein